MKKILTFVAVAGMAALVSCGGNDAAKKLFDDSVRQDSINTAVRADSTAKADQAKKVTDSTDAANAAKATADAAAAHQDSINKKLIKAPKK